MPEPDCFLRYRISAATWNFMSGKIPRIHIGGPPLQRGVILKWFYGPPLQRGVLLQWFYSLSCRNTFVGGKCTLPSAILVVSVSCQLLHVNVIQSVASLDRLCLSVNLPYCVYTVYCIMSSIPLEEITQSLCTFSLCFFHCLLLSTVFRVKYCTLSLTIITVFETNIYHVVHIQGD